MIGITAAAAAAAGNSAEEVVTATRLLLLLLRNLIMKAMAALLEKFALPLLLVLLLPARMRHCKWYIQAETPPPCHTLHPFTIWQFKNLLSKEGAELC